MRAWLTRQTRIALAAAVAFVVLAGSLAVLPMPYVIYQPGSAYDVLGVDPQGAPVLQVTGLPTYPATGKLHMTTVAVTRAGDRTNLVEAMLAYWMPQRDALPRDVVYAPNKSSDEVKAEERLRMDTSQRDAVVAALRQAGVPVEELPMVAAVQTSGPARDRLQPGDLILAINGNPVATLAEVRTQIRAGGVGAVVTLTVERERAATEVEVTTAANPQDASVPWIGIEVGTGYRYEPQVTFGISHDIGGPSAGLIFALALYDRISPGDLLQGRSVAGTGEIDAEGNVGRIGGIQEKLAGAEKAGVSVFLAPADNCADLAGVRTKIEIIRVETLADAIHGLEALGDPAQARTVPHC